MECVLTMAKTAREAEAALWQGNLFGDLVSTVPTPIDAAHSVAIATVEASAKTLAAAIIVITTSGRSAHLISKYKPKCPIIAVTRYPQTARQCHLYRGILPLSYDGKFELKFNCVSGWTLIFFSLEIIRYNYQLLHKAIG